MAHYHKCGFLSNHERGGGELISSSIYQFLPNLSVLRLSLKVLITPFGCRFNTLNVPSIELAIQLWVFEQSYRRRGRTNQFVYLPILIQSQCSWARLKGINHIFQTNLLTYFSVPYLLCNSYLSLEI